MVDHTELVNQASLDAPASSRGVKRVFIIDDHPAVREGLKVWITRCADLEVCGEASDVSDVEATLTETVPDVIVVDIELPTGNGLDFVKRVCGGSRRPEVVVWSMHDPALYADRARRSGAAAYISKREPIERAIEAIQTVAHGGHAARPTKGAKDVSLIGSVHALSDRELEVFQLLGQGLTMAQITDRLQISGKTVETYRARIKQKLELSSHNELLRSAMQWFLESR